MPPRWRKNLVRWVRRSRLGARIVAPLALTSRFGYVRHVGWLRSAVERESVDAQGRPIPWLCYVAIDLLGRRVQPQWKVFEFGGGNSTLWWAARVASVTCCEHSQSWIDVLRERVPENVELVCQGQGCEEYARMPLTTGGDYDLIVIDGRDRAACARLASQALKSTGVIVFDNTDRERYRPGLELLASAGFRRLDLCGLGPINANGEQTSILYRDGNCLGL